MKQCCTCKQDLDLTLFNNSSKTKDGKQRQCKACRNKSNDPQKAKERLERFFKRNPQKKAEYSAKWRETNPEYAKEYYADNKYTIVQRAVAYKRYRRANDPEYRAKDTLRSNLSNFLHGKIKTGSTQQLVGYTFEDFWQEFELDFLAFRLYGVPYEVDHKIPISWFTEDAPISIIWDLRNLHIVEAGLNSAKRNLWAHPVEDAYYRVAKPYLLRDGH